MPKCEVPEKRDVMPVSAAVGCLALAMATVLLLVVPGLGWGLPSELRNRLTLGEDRSSWRAPVLPANEMEDPWAAYPNVLRGGPARTGSRPRSAFNPIRSYHPDEYAILKSLSGMRPSRLKLFHGFFGWPAFHFYAVGATLQFSSWLGFIRLVPDMDFYFQDPGQMAALYMVGRVLTLVMALGCIIATWRAATRLFGREGGAAAALLLAATPLFAINAHYLTADIPMLFWISLTLLAATHILEGGGRRWAVLAGTFLGLAAGTRYQGALAGFVVAAAYLLREDEKADPISTGITCRQRVGRRLASRDLWVAAAVSIAVFLVVNPYILLRPGQFLRELSGELHASRNPAPYLMSVWLFMQSGLGILLSLAALGSLCLAAVRRECAAGFILIGFGIPAGLLLIGRPVNVRYMMPAVLLPALLGAWAFATFLRRGFEIGKRRTKAAVPILLGVLFLVTALQSWSYCMLFVRPEADTRTRAGEWIAENIPDGATIGVVSEPWQFELPPLNGRRFKTVIVAQDPEALAQARPEYFVTSDLQFPPVAVRGPLTPDEAGFRAEVFEGGGAYKVRRRFEAWPYGQEPALRHGPHDMRYANPVIVVAQRATAPKGRSSPGAGALLTPRRLEPVQHVCVITSSGNDSIVLARSEGGLP